MTIVLSFAAAGALIYAAARLGVFHHLACDEEAAWQCDLPEALEASIARSFDRDFDAIVAAERDRAMRQHPSWSDET